MKTVTTFLFAALCGSAALLSSCAKETAMPQPATPLSEFSFQNRTAAELIEAASPALYAQLLTDVQSNRGPILIGVPGRFVPGPWYPSTSAGSTCAGSSGLCYVMLVDDRTSGTLEPVMTDVATSATAASNSAGLDDFIFNENTPLVRAARGIRDVTVNAAGTTEFTVDFQ